MFIDIYFMAYNVILNNRKQRNAQKIKIAKLTM